MGLSGRADSVNESSRPRALRQLGIEAEKRVCSRPGLTWIAISGYSRTVPEEDWIAYGDDAGAASGLSALLHRTTGQWAFVGDAIADPLTGIHAALAAWRNWRAGGSKLLRSEEHTSELQSLMRLSYAVFCLKKTNTQEGDSPRQTRNQTA